MSAVAARVVCAASADLDPDDVRADPGAGGLAKPGADGHADPGSDGLPNLAPTVAPILAPTAVPREIGQVFYADKTSFIAT